MADHQQVARLGVTNRHESALILRMVGVVPRDGQRVGENCDSFFERDSVLAKILFAFASSQSKPTVMANADQAQAEK